jgi:hypothetical protein
MGLPMWLYILALQYLCYFLWSPERFLPLLYHVRVHLI